MDFGSNGVDGNKQEEEGRLLGARFKDLKESIGFNEMKLVCRKRTG